MILQKYIAKTILTSTLLVLLILLGIYTFLDLINELDDLGKGQYQFSNILAYLALSMPKRIYELLPIAALIGAVLGLGNLASQSELVVMRAAGMSIAKINKAVMLVAIVLMMIAVFVGEVVRPPAEQKARELQSVAQSGTVGSRSKHGFWTRDGYHFNHIEQILPDGSFEGISIYEFDADNRLRIITKANTAEYDEGTWTLSDVIQSTLDEKGVRVRAVEHARWKSELNPGMVNIVVVPPEFLPVWGLMEYINYLKRNHQAVEQYQTAFWSKVMMPISAAVMVFLAVPFIFGPLRSSSIGARILVGTLVGISFHIFNQSFQQMSLVFGVLPWLSAMTPPLMFGLIAYFLMKRVH
jgi:lipopolysaccharide export system permease protein